MKILLASSVFFLLAFLCAAGPAPAEIQSDSTCAIVGNRLIWTSDVQKREALRNSSFQEALNELIEENLLTFEADKEKITVTSDQVSARLAAMEKKAGSKKDFVKYLKTSGFLSLADYKRYLTNQLKVEKLLRKHVVDAITVTPFEVSSKMEQMPAGGQVLLKSLSCADLKSAVAFEEEFKKNPSAARDKMVSMDWLNIDSLNPEIAALIGKAPAGFLTAPSRVSGRYLIFYVAAVRKNSEEVRYVQARQALFQAKYEELLNQYIKDLKKTIPVKITSSSG